MQSISGAKGLKVPRLKDLREWRALSQGELAAKAGVSRGTVNHLEQDGEARPATVRKLAVALGVEPRELMGE